MHTLLLVLVTAVLCPAAFVPWSFGLGWNKVTYAGPGSDAMDLAWRAARGDEINKLYQNPLIPTLVTRAQQSGLHTQLEAVYVEANCIGVDTSAAPGNFDFVTLTKCFAKPLGKRSLYRVSEDKSAKPNKINAWKMRDVGPLEVFLG